MLIELRRVIERKVTSKMRRPRLLVLGDCSIDQYLATDPHVVADPTELKQRPGYRLLIVPGGAWLLRAVLEDIIRTQSSDLAVHGVRLPANLNQPDARHSLAVLKRFPNEGDISPAYRLSSRALFQEGPTDIANLDLPSLMPGMPTIAVLEHKSLSHVSSAITTQLERLTAQPTVCIHKLSSYVDNSHTLNARLKLGEALTIMLLDADTLRSTGYQVSKGLSWERTAVTAVQALDANRTLKNTDGPTLLIIRLGHAGFLQRFRASSDEHWSDRLLFDPSTIEGEWGDNTAKGMMFGYLSTVAAWMATEIGEFLRHNEHGDLVQEVDSIVNSALRRAQADNVGSFQAGFGSDLEGLNNFEMKGGIPSRSPFRRSDDSPLVSVDIPSGRTWELATEAFNPKNGTVSLSHPLRSARDIVRLGLEIGISNSLPASVPYAQIGQLFVIGQEQVENVRSMRATLDQYFSSLETKPLSVAVFGQPGAGKSFGVHQIVKSVSVATSLIEANLSQLRGSSELNEIFQRARDASVAGQVPIVFFDEFDTELDGRQLGWLRYFLAPMQDGLFQSPSGPSRLGRSVFVFAGGTAHRYEQFLEPLESETYDRNSKFPDFVSRLSAHLDMAGVGQRPDGDAGTLELLRRALLLRSILQRDSRGLIDPYTGRSRLDARLVVVLLTLPFRHGARSLELTVRLLKADGGDRLTLSSLPASESLRAHVNPAHLEVAVRKGIFQWS